MTKADLVEEVIRVADLSKKAAESVVNTVFEQIMEALKSDDKIELRGFGSFRVRRRRRFASLWPRSCNRPPQVNTSTVNKKKIEICAPNIFLFFI